MVTEWRSPASKCPPSSSLPLRAVAHGLRLLRARLAGRFHMLERVGNLASQAELRVFFPELLSEPRMLVAMLFSVAARAVSRKCQIVDGMVYCHAKKQSSRLMACCGIVHGRLNDFAEIAFIRDTLIEGFSHFATSVTAPIASGWSCCRVGLAPAGKRRLCTAHTQLGRLLPRYSTLASPNVFQLLSLDG
jgi:hypothetical protein